MTRPRIPLAAAAALVAATSACGASPAAHAQDAAPTAAPTTTPAAASAMAPSGEAGDVPVTAAAAGPAGPGTYRRPPTRRPDTRPRRWVPAQGLPWQVQYSGQVATSDPARVVDVDGAETSAAQVAAWHARGIKAVCYVNAGAWESWRPDAAAFPASVRGAALDGWPGEQWLDVRRLDVLLPIMTRRIDDCARKGFDAVDPDNVDGYANDSGFPLTADQQVAYVRALADLAHRRGLSTSLKNATGILPRLAGDVDFAVNEQCREYDECGAYDAFTRAGKAVVDIEYTGTREQVCTSVPRGFSRMIKRESLDAWTVRC